MRLKPRVGIVYSQSEKNSRESLNLANYLCGLLSASGYAEIFMIGYYPDGSPGHISTNRIKYIARGQNTPTEVPVLWFSLMREYRNIVYLMPFA